MSATHTQGPWIICVEDGSDDAYTIFAESQLVDGRISPETWDDCIAKAGLNHPNFEANACVIAAAPELLALLVESQTSIGGDWRKRRDAAVAKATGSEE